MRKLYLFMLMFCGLFLCGQAAQAQTSYVLSNETYDESTKDNSFLQLYQWFLYQ